jgi:selenocysteine lyase/cysteine desulfurase
MAAMDEAIDDDTRLVSIALVSNVNGYLADISALSDLAHARGAYLYPDIMQAAGAVPIDVRADLQGTVVRPTQHAGGISFNYEPWTDTPDTARPGVTFQPTEGPSQYEVSYPSYKGAICAQESLRYIDHLGVANIRAHARELTNRLHEELSRLGYRAITPRDNDSPILSFISPNPTDTVARCRQADVHIAMRFGDKLRLAPSVYNNHEDVDRLLQALA